jgi:uncharacterized protein DUF4389
MAPATTGVEMDETTYPVTFSVDYPDRKLNRLTTFFRIFAVIIVAWFAILLSGGYPRGLFDFLVGVTRWHNRVIGYALTLVTDAYPPFRLAP